MPQNLIGKHWPVLLGKPKFGVFTVTTSSVFILTNFKELLDI